MSDPDKQLIDRLLERHDELLRNIDALSRDNSRLREIIRQTNQGGPPPRWEPYPRRVSSEGPKRADQVPSVNLGRFCKESP